MAYGDKRTQKASDTFDSSIGASWENGAGNWSTCAWATGGYVNPSATSSGSSILRVSSETWPANQYSKVVVQAEVGASWLGPTVRQATGHAACYCAASGDGDLQINYFDDALAQTTLAGGSPGNLSAGESVTLEVEGNALRLGTDEGSGDGERYNTTDNTLTSGRPGVVLYATSAIGNAQITSWVGGEIGGSTGTGAPAAQSAAVSGTGERSVTGSGTPASQSASVSGTAERSITGSGTPAAQSASVAGAGERSLTGTGAPGAQSASVAGTGTVTEAGHIEGSGALAAQAATVAGTGARGVQGTGALAAQSAHTHGHSPSPFGAGFWASGFFEAGFWVEGFWGEVLGPGVFGGPGWVLATLQYPSVSVTVFVGPATVEATLLYPSVEVLLAQDARPV